MKFFFSDHFLIQISARRISKRLAQSIYMSARERYFDTSTKHDIAVAQVRHLGKLKRIMIAYDKIGDEVWFVTTYPLRDREIEIRLNPGGGFQNEKN